MKLSIVIVNYNVKYFLEQCLCSVRAATDGMEAEVFVVDNNSADGSVEYLKSRFPEAVFIENKDNPGFACANNQAIRLSAGEYILLLNPDTVIGEETLRTLCSFMDEHPEAGAAGVKMLDGHGRFLAESKRSFPSPWVSFCKMFGLSKLRPRSRTFARYTLPYLSSDQQHEVEVLAGAFMLLRREALDKAGLLDEAFFMYGEDIDLSYRIVLAGYKNYYIPERILHYKGESTKYADMKYVKAFYGSMLIFYRKYYPGSGWLMNGIIRLAVFFRALLSILFPRRKENEQSIKKRRVLVFCREADFKEVKAAFVKHFQEPEYIICNQDANQATDILCGGNQTESFTDYVFCTDTLRFGQMLLMMDRAEDKRAFYHIYNKESKQLI